jgi:acetyl-CoA acetyltransferase
MPSISRDKAHLMRQVAIVGFAPSPVRVRDDSTTGGVEMLAPILREAYAQTGLTRRDIGFWCSGSSDYLAGRAFSFVQAVDALGVVPPIMESHVEMDGAWALYEAWVKIVCGDADIALVYGFGKSSGAELSRVLALQLDPYLAAPLWPDAVSVAALQARCGIEAGRWTEKDMAQVAARSLASAAANSRAQVCDAGAAIEDLLSRPYVADPLRAHDCAPVGDGAAVVILASADRARDLCERPAWIRWIGHRIESASLGARDLATLATLGPDGGGPVDVAELHAPFTHQELILRQALAPCGITGETEINPSGGALTANPMFAAGLARIGYAARAIIDGRARGTLGHATGGPALQQNLVCVMEAR